MSVKLVNRNGVATGVMEKLKAHQLGVLHEAFSVVIFNNQNQLLLQQRASQKYHSGGLWTNTCCSHPAPEDVRPIEEIAKERLMFEMGFECELHKTNIFYYKAKTDDQLIEHEYDHIMFGLFNGELNFNEDEVQAVRWIELDDLREEMEHKPEIYTVWFKMMFEQGQVSLPESLSIG
jgi:isopentenyl-diphosphate delta-isomerase